MTVYTPGNTDYTMHNLAVVGDFDYDSVLQGHSQAGRRMPSTHDRLTVQHVHCK